MYIGPWQEYRLAKIQDDAIQRIRQEWEDNIRSQLPDSDDSRIRELMQPLMAKLPSLLMAKKSTDATDAPAPTGTRKVRRPTAASQSCASTRPPTAASTASSTQSRSESVRSRPTQNNQETHDDQARLSKSRRVISRQASSKKPKKKTTGNAAALDDVERRRRMFAAWMRTQREQPAPGAAGEPSTAPEATAATTRLPPIHTNSPLPSNPRHLAPSTESIRLPPIHSESVMLPNEPDEGPEVPSPQDSNLDDSLDEDEVNNLLDWTDSLLSPSALESSLTGLGMDLDDIG